MNGKQIAILISGLAVSLLIIWHGVPIEFPMIIAKMVMLFVELFIVLALTSLGYVLAASGRKSDHEQEK